MILLAHGYHLPLDPQEAALQKPMPPLGTLVAAGILRSEGLPFAFYDPTLCPDPATFAEALRGHRPARVALIADPHAIPQKQCTARQREAALQMIRLARAHTADIFVAGPDPTDHPDPYLLAGARHVALGEHEPALTDWARGLPLPAAVPRRPPIRDLDALPRPAWDQIDLRAYADRWRRAHGWWELNLSASRGCPYRCNWCAKPTWGRTYNARSPASLAEEIRDIQAGALGVTPDQIWFADDIFGVRPGWLRELRAALDRTPAPPGAPPLRYRCQHRADLLQDPQVVDDLRATGCAEVWLGAESGSDRVLAAMDKDGTVAEIRRAADLLRAAGIRRGLFLQLGYPGERPGDVDATARLVRDLRPEEIGISVSYPLPGTVFHARTRHRLRADRWETAMENRLIFDHDLPQPFYDHARAWIRADHAARRADPADLIRLIRRDPRRGLRRAAAVPLHAAAAPLHRAAMEFYARTASPHGPRPAPAADPGAAPGPADPAAPTPGAPDPPDRSATGPAASAAPPAPPAA